MELLRKKNYTLTETYSRCGFNNPTTFDRQFKKWVGCLPSKYKTSITFRPKWGGNKVVDHDF